MSHQVLSQAVFPSSLYTCQGYHRMAAACFFVARNVLVEFLAQSLVCFWDFLLHTSSSPMMGSGFPSPPLYPRTRSGACFLLVLFLLMIPFCPNGPTSMAPQPPSPPPIPGKLVCPAFYLVSSVADRLSDGRFPPLMRLLSTGVFFSLSFGKNDPSPPETLSLPLTCFRSGTSPPRALAFPRPAIHPPGCTLLQPYFGLLRSPQSIVWLPSASNSFPQPRPVFCRFTTFPPPPPLNYSGAHFPFWDFILYLTTFASMFSRDILRLCSRSSSLIHQTPSTPLPSVNYDSRWQLNPG